MSTHRSVSIGLVERLRYVVGSMPTRIWHRCSILFWYGSGNNKWVGVWECGQRAGRHSGRRAAANGKWLPRHVVWCLSCQLKKGRGKAVLFLRSIFFFGGQILRTSLDVECLL